MNPSILLLDEPLASLDPASAHEALQVFRSLADEGKTVILVEHRVEDAIETKPDRMMYMENGKIKYLGDIKNLPNEIDHKQVKLPAPWVVQRVKTLDIQVEEFNKPKVEEKSDPLVVFENVDFRYDDDLPLILENVNLKIYSGDLIAVLGPNGAGKSTLVKHAIGLLKPTKGRVLVNGKDTREMSVAQIARTLGFVFQSPTHMLYAPSVKEELEFGPKNLGYDSNEIPKFVSESLNAVNLGGFEEYPPLGLSFGQQKRTTIAAVLAMRSKILIMDEPTAGQDFANYTHFMETLCKTSEDAQSVLSANFSATLFITHDIDLAVTYSNRVLLFGDKHIVADGTPEEVLKNINLLKQYRVRPTSLLSLNVDLLPKTKRFLPAESLVQYI
ncbi:MAG: putative ABC transporter ATP-binding protein [Chloroflexi bacterium OLB14]|nr:MAG: putative ABC transporter ATP-binding protein [Chloroflexi bacterium OLB14]